MTDLHYSAGTIPSLNWTGAYWSVFATEDAPSGRLFTTRTAGEHECLRIDLLRAWNYFYDVQYNLYCQENTADDVVHLNAEIDLYGAHIDALEAQLGPVASATVRSHWTL